MQIGLTNCAKSVQFLGDCPHIKMAPKIESDSFEKTSNIKDAKRKHKMAAAIDYAKKACAVNLHYDNPTEHSVAIDSDGNVIYENDGEAIHCRVEYDKLQPDTTIIHGHPGEKLKPLSPSDVVILLSYPQIKTVAAVDKNGNGCALTKTPNTRVIDDRNLRKNVDDCFIKTVLDGFGISYDYDDDYVKKYEEKLKEIMGIKDTDALYKLCIGTKKPDNPKEAMEALEFQCMYHNLRVMTPHEMAFFEDPRCQIDEESDEFIAIQKKFMHNIARKYNLQMNYDNQVSMFVA